MRIDSSGNVGIGTSSPSTKFHVAGGDLRLNDNFAITWGGTGAAIIGANNTLLRFDVNGSERMRIDSSGNVGIGSTSPTAKLQVTGTIHLTGAGSFPSTGEGLEIVPAAAGGNNFIQAYSRTASTFQILKIGSSVTMFETGGSERMRIDSSGNLCLGQTSADGKFTSNASSASQRSIHAGQLSASATTDGVYYAYCNTARGTGFNFAQYQNASGIDFIVFGNGNVQNRNNSYAGISDAKLKENIVDATPKLTDLCKVKVRNYNFIDGKDKQIGVVAQELETIFPSLVEETKDRDEDGNILETSTKSVKYSVFVPMLIKAIQEQQTLINNLTTRLNALEGK
jgi:hypothetical protein